MRHWMRPTPPAPTCLLGRSRLRGGDTCPGFAAVQGLPSLPPRQSKRPPAGTDPPPHVFIRSPSPNPVSQDLFPSDDGSGMGKGPGSTVGTHGTNWGVQAMVKILLNSWAYVRPY